MDFFMPCARRPLRVVIEFNFKVDYDLRQAAASSTQRLKPTAFLKRLIACGQLQFHIDRSSEVWR
jgi:hypothetical protein